MRFLIHIYLLATVPLVIFAQNLNYVPAEEDSTNYFVMVGKFLNLIELHSKNASKKSSQKESLQFVKESNYENKELNSLLKENLDVSDLLQTLLISETFSSSIDESSSNTSSKCLIDSLIIVNELRLGKVWAISFIDAWGKPQPGLFGGATKWMGDYETCLTASSPSLTDGGQFHGQYCDSFFVFPNGKGQNFSIQLGSCVPQTCTTQEWRQVLQLYTPSINNYLKKFNLQVLSTNSYCHPPWGSQPLSKGAISMIVILSVFTFSVLIGTILDLWNNTSLLQLSPSLSDKSQSRMDLLEETRDSDLVEEDCVQDEATESSGQDCSPPSSNSSGSTPWSAYTENVEFNDSHLIVKILCAFSLYRNFFKLFNVKSSPNSGTLRCIHGIRFLSMCWVILGHTYFFALTNNNNSGTFTAQAMKSKSFSLILNGPLSVDTFFCISGVLTAYLFYKAVENNDGPFTNINFWELFYFHRFWRLTPPYMLFMGTYYTLFYYLWQGSSWPAMEPGIDSHCGEYWWTNLLYVNNIVHSKEMCMGWSWYLSNDMQFYVISPLLMVPFYYSRIAGGIIHLLFLIGTMLATGLISYFNKLGPNDYSTGEGVGFDLIYVKPWCRFAPYVIGLAVGYLLHTTKCKVKLHRAVVLIGWCFSLALSLTMIYTVYPVTHHSVNLSVAALFNSTNRVGWSLAVAWMVFACCTDNGGVIDSILSWKVFIPLSRLTYCAYLVHPVVMLFFYLTMESPVLINHATASLFYFGFLMASYGLAFIVSMLFEAPMLELEKIFVRK